MTTINTQNRPGRSAKHWTDQASKDEFIIALAGMHRGGAKRSDLAARFGLSVSRVGHLVRQEGTAIQRVARRLALGDKPSGTGP